MSPRHSWNSDILSGVNVPQNVAVLRLDSRILEVILTFFQFSSSIWKRVGGLSCIILLTLFTCHTFKHMYNNKTSLYMTVRFLFLMNKEILGMLYVTSNFTYYIQTYKNGIMTILCTCQPTLTIARFISANQ